jgi:hypothetical protein
MRYTVLRDLLELGLAQWPHPEARILNAFARATADPDPAVRSFAVFALTGGLAGDPLALAQVHVGPDSIAAFDAGEQPPSPPAAEDAPHYEGFFDEAGVFIASIVPAAPMGTQPPPAPPAGAAAQHAGYHDESGVFIGTAKPDHPTSAGRQPQP